ncbi:translocation and assembly module protein TamB [Aliigemmobacter aestuarii]|uniref:Translocation and assembly module protein TamB n=1 Tax=Aliigemmobacter aestuarii TaxID=1445661 RepID=A0A4S3MTD8_9RHOB|nr:translocation/assembly module TamB domain-containing protein [Gemmobacter aestuarii]THD85434.1 translocation and assembly module protein TamB [Gemmobacter aestuarii]
MRRLLFLFPLLSLPVTGLAQEDDRGYLTALLEDNLSTDDQKVTITGFEGALSSRATMAELTIADADGPWLTLRDVALDWSRAALLSGNVQVNELTAAEIRLDRLPPAGDDQPTPEAAPFALPELPVSIQIGKIAADTIVLGEPILGTLVEGRLEAAASLAGGEGSIDLTLERTDGGPDGVFDLTAGYSNATRNLLVSLDAREDAGGLSATLLGIPGAPDLELTVKGDAPISDFTADIRLLSDGQERLAGAVEIASEPEGATRFAARLGGDPAPLFLPEYADFFGDALQLQADGLRSATGQLTLSQLVLTARGMQIAGSGIIAPDGLPEQLDLDVTMGSPDGQPLLLPFATDAGTAMRDARLRVAFDASRGDGWSLSGQLNGLSRTDLTASQVTLNGSGRINRGTGTGARPVVGGTVRFGAEGLAMADPALAELIGSTIQGTGTFFWQEGSEALTIPRIELGGADYGMTAGLRIRGLHSGITISGRADAEVGDLSRASRLAGRTLAGAARLSAEGETSLLGGAFDLVADVNGTDLGIGISEVDNLLRGASKVSVSVRRDETGTTLRALEVAAASLTADASGRYATAGSDITANLDFADLSVMGGPYGGALAGVARFTGTPDDGTLSVDARGEGLRIGVAEADALMRGASTVTLEAAIRGTAVDIRRLDVKAATLDASITGLLDPNGSDLAAQLGLSDLSGLGNGYRGSAQLNATVRGTPEAAQVAVNGTGTNLAIGQAEADTLLRGTSTLSANLSIDGDRIRVDGLDLTNPQLSARASGRLDGADRTLDVDARLTDLGILLAEFPGPATISGTAREDATGYVLDLAGRGPGGIDARISGRLDGRLQGSGLRIAGSARAELANPFIRPRTARGPVSFDVTVNGPFAPRSLSGRIALTGAELADPTLPFSVLGLNVQADLASGRAALSGGAQISTGGQVAIDGSVGLEPPFDATIASRLTNVVLRDPKLFETRLNGDIAVRGPLTGGAVISGSVLLLETELRVPSTGMTGLGDVPGLQHVNEPGAVRETRRRAGLLGDAADETAAGGRPFGLDLLISAPSRLFIRGRGLDAELGGELRVAGTTDQVVPSGAFALIRGRLDILGKRLNLSEATLQLEGDFNPILRILASTESDGIVSSVSIEGPADTPEVSFVSVPELPEEEVLARLLFDRGLTNLSALQAVQLASAVATLAGRGGEGIVSKLRKGIGLDDLDVETDADGGTSVRAGKYISRNVYTEVEVDDKGQSEINLNLDITPNLTVRGTAGGDGTSIGIFLEKDY